ncbi:MAG TPA: transcriptional repressor LexA [Dissulfurispiraceae bacterium]|nr:transcriptional repressor LexA [Dissulfurispiraceae bacterium]
MPKKVAKEILMKRAESIRHFYQARDRMPSFSEIGDLIGLSSKSSVSKLVHQLHNHNLVDLDPAGHLLPGRMKKPIRMLGTVEAGIPSAAEQESAEAISLDEFMIGNCMESFLLRVSGDSMQDLGILPGDMVVVDRSVPANNGDIVIAEVDGAWTMKKLRKSGAKVALIAANRKYKPIHPKNELKIAGVVTGVVRKY